MIRRRNPVSYHQPCRHRSIYGMTCAEFDKLFERAGGRCQICDVLGSESTHEILVIDHDNQIGFKAVRGLLCSNCNTLLGGRTDWLDVDAVDHYLSNAWHLTHRTVRPSVVHIPHMSREQVSDLLIAAAAWCRAPDGRPLRDPASRRPLVTAVRIAAKAGMRQCEIQEAIGRLWTREQIYYALHERGRKLA